MEAMPKICSRKYLIGCRLGQVMWKSEHDDLRTSFPTKGQFYTLWDFWLPAFTCPHKVERIGTLGDGGKYVCGLERLETKKECVVYSVGKYGLAVGNPFSTLTVRHRY